MDANFQPNWKKISKAVTTSHREWGASVYDVKGKVFTDGYCVNLTPEEDQLVKNGPDLHPKEIRRWLWDHRNSRSLSRGTFLVWTSYDLDTNKSYLGIGASVPNATAERFPPTHKVLV